MCQEFKIHRFLSLCSKNLSTKPIRIDFVDGLGCLLNHFPTKHAVNACFCNLLSGIYRFLSLCSKNLSTKPIRIDFVDGLGCLLNHFPMKHAVNACFCNLLLGIYTYLHVDFFQNIWRGFGHAFYFVLRMLRKAVRRGLQSFGLGGSIVYGKL